jgi:hypothetical protein
MVTAADTDAAETLRPITLAEAIRLLRRRRLVREVQRDGQLVAEFDDGTELVIASELFDGPYHVDWGTVLLSPPRLFVRR